jgi:hypothetical protein
MCWRWQTISKQEVNDLHRSKTIYMFNREKNVCLWLSFTCSTLVFRIGVLIESEGE